MSKNITVNGTTYDASYVNAPLADGSGNAAFRESSELLLQSKSVTPTEAEQSVTSDPPYFGLSSVAVKAIPNTYVKPTATNAGGELTAGSTIAAGTYFSGTATVPSSGGLAEGQTAVHDIPNGKILSTQKVLSAITVDNELTITMTLPDSFSLKNGSRNFLYNTNSPTTPASAAPTKPRDAAENFLFLNAPARLQAVEAKRFAPATGTNAINASG